DVLFDIDWQGTQQLYAKMRDDVVSVFVLPPSAAELKSRLERRAQDSQAVIAQRLHNAVEEISHWREYDYVLVNRDLDKSFARVRAILTAERLKRVQAPDLENFVAIAGRSEEDSALRQVVSGWRRNYMRERCHTGMVPCAAKARASATKPATGISSARAVGSRPAAPSSIWGLAPSDLRLCRNIFRRWPKAASVTRCSSFELHASGSARGVNCTSED